MVPLFIKWENRVVNYLKFHQLIAIRHFQKNKPNFFQNWALSVRQHFCQDCVELRFNKATFIRKTVLQSKKASSV